MQCVHGLIGVFNILLVVIVPIYAQYRYGDIRLVGGSYQWEGRVEIFISGTWGTITDSEWTNNDAQVVCRKLGHFKPGATAHSDAYFGEGSGPIHLDFVKCSGSEYNLTECEIRNDRDSTSHSFDVGVKCQPADEAYREGDIRLVGGSYNWEGRVEIYWTGTWGTISDTSWSNSDAKVVCRQLGHSTNGTVGLCCGNYREGSGAIHIRKVICSGSERTITSCNYFNNTLFTVDSHEQDVEVKCQQGNNIKEGDIRLVAGSYLWQGLVEIFLDGVWDTINYYSAGSTNARVVCRQLGYNTYNVDYNGYKIIFDETEYPVLITSLSCRGSENRVTDCPYSNNTLLYSLNYLDWIVYCYVDGPETGDVRLTSLTNGRVDTFLSGIWVPVTDSSRSWTLQNSKIVCRELGYNGTKASYALNDYRGSWSTMTEMIDNVDCTGTESKLMACSHNINYLDSYNSPRVRCQYYDCGDGDIRLVNGKSEMEGRVEICKNRRWGTVCDKQWTDNHTAVVCRYLGFSDIIGESTKEFGEGSGPILIDYVNCTGSESRFWGHSRSLKKCLSFTHYYGCSHSSDVGVRCQPASCSDGQIKLIEGSLESTGRVEICSNQRWESVPDDCFAYDEATVACISLGFDFGHYCCCAHYGRGGGPIHQKHFQCAGTEQDLSQCDSFNDTTPRTHDEDVGIECYATCIDGTIRLMEGESEFEGRLEVCINDRWGTVGSNGWTKIDEQVICNDFGYDLADNETVKQSIPQALSKPVHLHNIVCSSTDLHLLECSFSKYTGNINDVQDVIITCQQPSCQDGDLKLVGGISENEGRLEVCFDQRWGTINGDGWTHADTQVACRQLGYSTSDVSYAKTKRTPSSIISLPVHLSLVGCYGSEEKLIDCAHHEYATLYSTDISISCGSSSSGNSVESNMSAASLSIAIICAFAMIVLVTVLIIIFFRRKRLHAKSSNQLSAGQMTEYADTITNGGISNISTDTMKIDLALHDDPMQYYEDVEFGVSENPLPVPPKPQPKRPLKKPAVTSTARPGFSTNNEAFPSNENDYLHQFVKSLD